MPIKGLTDKQQPSFYSVICHKGTRKRKQGIGDDLHNFLRLETLDLVARQAIVEQYVLTDKGFIVRPNKPIETVEKTVKGQEETDILVQELDIFLYDDVDDQGSFERTFPTAMKRWDHSGLVSECDRQSINQERVTISDRYGSLRTRLQACKKPCPVAKEPNIPCPNGCVTEGVLKFYIPAVLDAGINRPCSLVVKGFYDLSSILQSLEKIYAEFGSIRCAPDNFPTFRGLIPLVLKRTKIKIKRPVLKTENNRAVYHTTDKGAKIPVRTGKKTDGFTWAVTIEVNPLWSKAYYAWKQAIAIKALGFDALPESPSPVLLPEPTLGEREFTELAQLWEMADHRWESKEAFCKAAIALAGVNSFAEIPLSKFEKIKNLIK